MKKYLLIATFAFNSAYAQLVVTAEQLLNNCCQKAKMQSRAFRL
jgi:hypothetical protein